MDKAREEALARAIVALNQDRYAGLGDFIYLLPGSSAWPRYGQKSD